MRWRARGERELREAEAAAFPGAACPRGAKLPSPLAPLGTRPAAQQPRGSAPPRGRGAWQAGTLLERMARGPARMASSATDEPRRRCGAPSTAAARAPLTGGRCRSAPGPAHPRLELPHAAGASQAPCVTSTRPAPSTATPARHILRQRGHRRPRAAHHSQRAACQRAREDQVARRVHRQPQSAIRQPSRDVPLPRPVRAKHGNAARGVLRHEHRAVRRRRNAIGPRSPPANTPRHSRFAPSRTTRWLHSSLTSHSPPPIAHTYSDR